MRLTHFDIGKEISFVTNKKQLLIVENSKEFFHLVSDLLNQISGQEGEFVLADGLNLLEISKEVLLIHNYFEIDFNNKKIENAINSEILSVINSNDYFQILSEINEKFVRLNERIKNDMDIELTFDEDLSAEKLVKIAKFKVNDESELLSKIIAFVDINLKLKKQKLLILVNVSQVLSQIEIEKLLKQLDYFDVNLLLIENYQKYLFENFEKTIIDEDLCVI